MSRATLTAVLLLCALGVRPAAAQVPQPSPSAKACAYLPIADLAAHFGIPPQSVRGIDQPTRNTCNANFPNPRQAAVIESHPPNAGDRAMTAAQRLGIIKAAFTNSETKDFGSVGCVRATLNMGEPVLETTCFLAKSRYLSLSIRSAKPALVSFEAVKKLLEKTAARRK